MQKLKQKKPVITITRQDFYRDLEKASRKIEKPKSSPKPSKT